MNTLFDTQARTIVEEAHRLAQKISLLPLVERVRVLNEVRVSLHEVSPFSEEPTDCVVWVNADDVEANNYNPNGLQKPEFALLSHSVESDGFTMPIVGWRRPDGRTEVVDGFHRSKVGKENKRVQERVHGYLPISYFARKDWESDDDYRNRCMAATVRHNRARGTHTLDGMSKILLEMLENGWDEYDVAKQMGMGADEVIRLKQVWGVAHAHALNEFNRAWVMDDGSGKADV